MKPRRYLTQKQKDVVLERQDNRCNLPECRKALISGLYEWDHIQDRQFDGDNELDNWQAICTKPCHLDKTKRAAANKSRANKVRLGKPRKWRPMSRDQRDNPDFVVESAARDVRIAISRITSLAMQYPDLLRREAVYLSNAADDLNGVVATLLGREAAE